MFSSIALADMVNDKLIRNDKKISFSHTNNIYFVDVIETAPQYNDVIGKIKIHMPDGSTFVGWQHLSTVLDIHSAGDVFDGRFNG